MLTFLMSRCHLTVEVTFQGRVRQLFSFWPVASSTLSAQFSNSRTQQITISESYRRLHVRIVYYKRAGLLTVYVNLAD